jgi:hypothetical protein
MGQNINGIICAKKKKKTAAQYLNARQIKAAVNTTELKIKG